jgi:GAF domain-containing protein
MPSEVSIAGARGSTVEELKQALDEAREERAALAEVLLLIASSPGELQPVFHAMLTNAVHLCGGKLGDLYLCEADGFRMAACHNAPPAYVEARTREPVLRPPPDAPLSRLAVTKQVVQITDIKTIPSYIEGHPFVRAAVDLAGYRTVLTVPMLKGDQLIGAIAITRQEVQPFTDKQIALVQNFAAQAVIAIENARLFEVEQASKRELQESLEYQTAMSEVLGVISRSTFELQPVLEAVVESATRLCGAKRGHIFRFDGEYLHFAAAYGAWPGFTEFLKTHAFRPGRGGASERAALEGRTVHIADVLLDSEYERVDLVSKQGYRTVLAVPMLREGTLLGVIAILKTHVEPFTDKQIALVETFADQAVIAIENTRLFEAEQARTREVEVKSSELAQSLEYQTAISEVLAVISRSPNELQPVFDAILASCVRLLGPTTASVTRLVGRELRLAAFTRAGSQADAELQRHFPLLLDGNASMSMNAIAVRELKPVMIEDTETDGRALPALRDVARRRGYRSLLVVPMQQHGQATGTIKVTRAAPGEFSHKEITLLQIFADQAVIAIENTRLFEAEQASKRELQESLEYQTATTEVLDVISRSPTNSQPVLDAIAASVRRLTGSTHGSVCLFDGKQIHLTAHSGIDDPVAVQALAQSFPQIPSRGVATARAILSGQVAYIPDVLADAEYRVGDVARAVGYRSIVSVPMLREDHPIGAITAMAESPSKFSPREITLLQTFANQAVIAINNAGLFEEVQARNRHLTALGEVGRAVSSTLELRTVLKTIVDRAIELSSTDGGSIFYFRNDRFELGETTGLDEEAVARFRRLDISAGQTGLGEAIAKREPLQVPDILDRTSNPLRDAAIEAGLRAALIVPLLSSDGPLGALVLQRRTPGEFSAAVVTLMQSFADQSAIALENARLFEEIAQKSHELEIASQHKSQFVANMSHELRTPLAAILGYAELMQEGFYEPLGQKSLAALTRIRSNGKHLLGLINTVLDIAKIESGQFTLNMSEYAIESVVETVRAATESLAQNKNLTLTTSVDKPLPVGLGDEQRLTQVLLNLVGNAIKFTDTGEVRVTAKTVNGNFNVSVTDTGPGIPEEHQARIFEQFHQVDSSSTKAKGGTGLGLAIAKQIVELHGGRIWVESTLGKGSTFQMELPARA